DWPRTGRLRAGAEPEDRRAATRAAIGRSHRCRTTSPLRTKAPAAGLVRLAARHPTADLRARAVQWIEVEGSYGCQCAGGPAPAARASTHAPLWRYLYSPHAPLPFLAASATLACVSAIRIPTRMMQISCLGVCTTSSPFATPIGAR